MEDEKKKNGANTEPQDDLLPAEVGGATKEALDLLDKEKTELLWRVAQKFARSGIVPEIFRGKPDDCFIALQMAARTKSDPLMLMQSAYIVHGKLGFEAKFAVGLVNNSGLIVGRLKFEEAPAPGSDPFGNKYAVRAYATDKETGHDVFGEWITWTLVKAEGWDSKAGSKWKTMPGQMFHYRAATFFIRRHYPEVLMGMQTADEIIDAEFTVTSEDRTAALQNRLTGKTESTEGTPEPPETQGNGQTVEDYAEGLKAKQGKLWTLLEKVAGGDVIQTEKLLHSIAGTIQLETLHGEDLDTAIKAAEQRLKEKTGKPKGKGRGKKNQGEMF